MPGEGRRAGAAAVRGAKDQEEDQDGGRGGVRRREGPLQNPGRARAQDFTAQAEPAEVLDQGLRARQLLQKPRFHPERLRR